MADDHLLVEARTDPRRFDDQEESAIRRASEALAERLQREVELFMQTRGHTTTPDA